MKRIGQVVYELTEEEYKHIKGLIDDIAYYFEYDSYKSSAEEAVEKLNEIFKQ